MTSVPAAVTSASDEILLVALLPYVFDDFLSEPWLLELKTAFKHVIQATPEQMKSADAWKKLFADHKPTAVLTGWSTPAIPEAALPTLRIVAHTAGGVRQLVTRQMIERGLFVTNWGSMAGPSVAEAALMLVLATLRRLRHVQELMHNKRPPVSEVRNLPTRGLFGRRVGLHGFGFVARNLVEMLKPFGCKISSYSAGVPKEYMQHFGVTQAASLDELFSNAEILVEVEAWTPQTEGSVTEAHFRMLPDGACFVNVGRGRVIDQRALERVAQEGNLQIGLDVYDIEPLPLDSPFRGLLNVTLTPHTGGPTPDLRPTCGRRQVDNLLRFARGEQPPEVVTPEIYDRST